jgi:hypothetical protein
MTPTQRMRRIKRRIRAQRREEREEAKARTAAAMLSGQTCSSCWNRVLFTVRTQGANGSGSPRSPLVSTETFWGCSLIGCNSRAPCQDDDCCSLYEAKGSG